MKYKTFAEAIKENKPDEVEYNQESKCYIKKEGKDV
jgi:hypothetical protein